MSSNVATTYLYCSPRSSDILGYTYEPALIQVMTKSISNISIIHVFDVEMVYSVCLRYAAITGAENPPTPPAPKELSLA